MFTEGLLYSRHLSKHLQRFHYLTITVTLGRKYCCCPFIVWWKRGPDTRGNSLQVTWRPGVSRDGHTSRNPEPTCSLFCLSERSLGHLEEEEEVDEAISGDLELHKILPGWLEMLGLLCPGSEGGYKTRMLTEVGGPGVRGFSLSGAPSVFSEGFHLQSLAVGFSF